MRVSECSFVGCCRGVGSAQAGLVKSIFLRPPTNLIHMMPPLYQNLLLIALPLTANSFLSPHHLPLNVRPTHGAAFFEEDLPTFLSCEVAPSNPLSSSSSAPFLPVGTNDRAVGDIEAEAPGAISPMAVQRSRRRKLLKKVGAASAGSS